jgi:hypothetical protein
VYHSNTTQDPNFLVVRSQPHRDHGTSAHVLQVHHRKEEGRGHRLEGL